MKQDERLKDNEFRKMMLERYLDAGTSVEEELALAEYYSENEPEGDEIPSALLVKISTADITSETAAEEFDRIAAGQKHTGIKSGKVLGISLISACAAAIVLFLIFHHSGEADGSSGLSEQGSAEIILSENMQHEERRISPEEMVDCIQNIMDLCGDGIASVAARPAGDAALVTANMKDGTSIKYIMTYDRDGGSASFIALNE